MFLLPENEEQKKQWIKFSNQRDIFHKESQYLLQTLCRQSSEERSQKKKTKLLYECKLVPTIIPVTRENENLPTNAIFETIETPRKPPRQKIFREDQMKPLKKNHMLLNTWMI